MMKALAIVVLFASVAAASLTRYAPSVAYPLGGGIINLAKDTTCTACEFGTVTVSEYDKLVVECDGSCLTQLVCRQPGEKYDEVLATLAPTDALLSASPIDYCDTAYFQIITCTPTATSPACKVRAWLR